MIVVYGQATASLGHWFGVAYVELDLGRNPHDLFNVAARAFEVAGLVHSDRDLFHVVLCELGAVAPLLFVPSTVLTRRPRLAFFELDFGRGGQLPFLLRVFNRQPADLCHVRGAPNLVTRVQQFLQRHCSIPVFKCA